MSRKKSKKKIVGLLKQAELHKRVYSENHKEAGIYGQAAERIIEKTGMSTDSIDQLLSDAQKKSQKEFCKRLQDMVSGKKRFDKSAHNLDFFRLMKYLEGTFRSLTEIKENLPDIDENRISAILENMVYCKYASKDMHSGDYSLTSRGREIFASINKM